MPTRTTAAADRGSASSTPSQGNAGSPVNQRELSSSPSRCMRPDLPGDLASTFPRDYVMAPATGELNLDHAELLRHCYDDEDIYILFDKTDDFRGGIKFALGVGQQYPYLLHEILALAACHLAVCNPNVPKYHHLAFDLQTRAVALYNASSQDITPENCAAVLLFSTVLGQHLFTDLLRPRDFPGLPSFMQRFTHCVAMQRGIDIVYQSAGPVLMENPVLEQYFRIGLEAQRRKPVGSDCAELTAMIYDSQRLTTAEKDACIHAAVNLQLGFDALSLSRWERSPPCFKFVLSVRPPLRALLEALQPDALVVLAYFGLLLHFNRNVWAVGTAGAYIIGMVTEHLGADYPWLTYPRRRMADSI